MANEKLANGMPVGPLLEARDLSMSYVSGNLWSRHRARVQALDKVSLSIQQNEILAVVGESGSGKSTLARVLTLMERPQVGSLLMNNEDLAQAPESRLRALRPELQMIHQDVATSFNPRFT